MVVIINPADNFNPLPPCGGRQNPPISAGFLQLYFNPLPPCGGRRQDQARREWKALFQSTPSVWRETSQWISKEDTGTISIHSLRVEGDMSAGRRSRSGRNFNPLPPCGGRLNVLDAIVFAILISIHSLRVEGDRDCPPWRDDFTNFNPLPPCGGRRLCSRAASPTAQFQSTPSVWRETSMAQNPLTHGAISIHSLRVEGDHVRHRGRLRFNISIHSLRVEGDMVSLS